MLKPGLRGGLLLAASAMAVAGVSEAAETVTYGYDALGRLTATSSSGTVNNGVSTSIRYDPAGNRSSYAVAGVGGSGGGSSGGGGGTGGGGGGEPPPPAVFAVGDSSAAEGGSLVFVVTKSGGTGGASSVAFATANGSAAAGSDYQATSGTLSFAAAETSKTVTVAGIEDSLDENSETVLLDLSGASAGASISDSQGVGTLGDNDDPAPPPPPSNNPPTAKNNSGSQAKCTTALYDVVSDDTDIDGDTPLALVSVDGIGFTILSTTTVQFVSTASTGPKVGTYVVQDRRGATASAKLTVTVSGGTCNSQAPAPGPLPSAPTRPEGGDGS